MGLNTVLFVYFFCVKTNHPVIIKFEVQCSVCVASDGMGAHGRNFKVGATGLFADVAMVTSGKIKHTMTKP